MTSTALTRLSPSTPTPQRLQLIYLPGMDGTGQLFYRQAALLKDFFVIRCMRFNAWADPRQETWENLAELVRSKLDPERPTVFCGESFGACVALQVAVRNSSRCAGLILVNPASSFRRGPWWLGAGSRLLPWVPDLFYRALSDRSLTMLAELDQIAPSDRQNLADAVRSVPPEVTHRRLMMLSQFNPEYLPLERLKFPVLLVAGAQDRLLPSVDEVNRLSQRFAKAAVEIAPQSGHACLLERQLDLRRMVITRQLLPAFWRSGVS